ncbi:MAG: AAA family ATPase [Cyanobacteria bacterium P01_C01_bin.38]
MIATQVSIRGYSIKEELYNGSRTLVYRAIRDSDEKPVVIKLLKNPYPNFNELLQFRNQYTIAKNLDVHGIVSVYSLEVYQNSYALVMEDFGGVSLREYIKRGEITSAEDILSIGVQITDIIQNLHQNRVIHKDIKPANILIHPQTKQIKLIDFSIASLLPKETPEIKNPNGLEGTLAYISPEQTGRMNRGIDYRTDFYALGVTFYELLTGELPFKSDDAMELVHCHIAKMPPEMKPHPNPLLGKERGQEIGKEREQEIPQVLSDIVMKLMAKNAEDRYQSALGLNYDLKVCLKQLQEIGYIEYFEIAQRDICDRFIIPEKLYGRENEVGELLAAFERVSGVTSCTSCSQALPGNTYLEALPLCRQAEPASTHYKAEPCNEGKEGKAELMLVAGFSGIGKTAVVNEVHKPIVKQRGYFIKGKFDQFNRNIPYCAFVQAFRDLMEQLLSESDTQLSSWRERFLQSLGDNAQVIIDVIPELERIIGKQPPATELSGTAAENRFNLLFQKFIQLLTRKEHPLVIFLDDLQWADSASLQLMQLLMSESETNYLLLIGAYRDNEVFPAHPLMLTLDKISKANSIINRIHLNLLNEQSLNQLVADTLYCTPEVSHKLTRLIYQKTKGNPFFSTQFLKSLYEDGFIEFDFSKSYWQCDISSVRKAALTDDVVEFMALQLQKLPESTQSILKLAACIGNQFDLATLATVCQQSETETAADLWKALQVGLIVPQSEVYKFYLQSETGLRQELESQVANYKFLHDRVQQAAYYLIPEEDKQKTHFEIGQILLKHIPKHEQENRIFDIVSQLNFGLDLIKESRKKDELARLNLIASYKAKDATAYDSAAEYAANCKRLLPENSWDNQYELTLSVHNLQVEIAYLTGDFTWMEKLASQVLEKSKTTLDKVKIYETKIEALTTQKDMLGAVNSGLEILKMLGVEFPNQPSPADIDAAFKENAIAMANKKPSQLLEMAQMQKAEYVSAMRIMMYITPCVHIAKPQLFPLLCLKQIHLSLSYGNAPTSSFAYTVYAILLCGAVGDIASAYEFASLGLELSSRSLQKSFKSRTVFVAYCFTMHWKQHLSKSLQPLELAYSSSLEVGDLTFAGYCANTRTRQALHIGKPLNELALTTAKYSKVLQKINQINTFSNNEIFRQTILNLIGDVKNPILLIGKACNETNQLPILESSKDGQGLAFLYIHKLFLAYMFGDFYQAIENSEKAKKYFNEIAGMYIVSILFFYESLSRLQTFISASDSEQLEILKCVDRNQSKMKDWAYHAPMNHQHKVDLVEAEKHRVLDDKTKALELYDKAIAGAKANEYIQEEALANELAAKFYLDWGKEKVAAGYMQEAYYCYANWGAKAKTDDLEKRYPQLLLPILQTQKHSFYINETQFPSLQTIQTSRSSSSISDTLDFASILKATQAISSKIQLEDLISTLLQTVIENAGAEKAALIFLKEDNFSLEAIANKDSGVTHLSIPYEISKDIPVKLINYVKHSLKTIVFDNLTFKNDFTTDKYLIQQQPKSFLCTPILKQAKLIGLLYLENKLTRDAFTRERLEIVKILSTQAAIYLENARIYKNQQKTNTLLNSLLQTIPDFFFAKDLQGRYITVNSNLVDFFGKPIAEIIGKDDTELFPPEFATAAVAKDREIIMKEITETFEEVFPINGENYTYWTVKTPLKDSQGTTMGLIGISRNITDRKQAEEAVIQKSNELEKALQELNQAQLQMVQNEKMATLGNLVAGVAHEVNNPIGFLKGSINNAEDYLKDIFGHLELYQENYPNPEEEVADNAEDIDLEFISEDLPKLLNSMRVATERIKDISTSLRTFSRADTSKKVACNIHEGIDSTILILKYRLKANEKRPGIEIIKKYGKVPPLECFLGQLSQVFMNIIANAIDALDTFGEGKTYAEIEANPHKITIQTELISEENTVLIRIKDNGSGIPESVRERIFDNLFTTKGVGKGTGLGLAIARAIVEETHGGKLTCNSVVSEGTEFVIELPIVNSL